MGEGRLEAVNAAIGKIDQDEFAEYGGGWRGEIGTALVDAVFSIRARYQAKNPAKGVYGRLKKFRELHPETVNDLSALVALGAPAITEAMGSTKTAGRLKSDCVIEAAQGLLALDPAVETAEQLGGTDRTAVEDAYTAVEGLGSVTCEYFLMLLGVPGVKADTMIVRFVNNALEAAGFDPVRKAEARALVVGAYELDSRGVPLTAYDHAIWRAKGELVLEEELDG